MNLLEIKKLSVEYETRSAISDSKKIFAVNDLSLSVKKGEIFSIAGESGCGKSTLLKALIRLVSPSQGEIIYNDKNILSCTKSELKEFRRKIQMIFQNPYSSLNPKMKIYDTLKEPLIINEKGLTKQEIDEIISKVISNVGLEESSLGLYPHEFSGGQRQRIAIARALILNPEIILADEPVSALDVSIQGQIINLLKELQEKLNLTIIFISHDLNVIRYISDRVAIMYLGEIVELGTRDEIFDNPLHPYTKALLSANPSNKGEKIYLKGEIKSSITDGCRFQTRCKNKHTKCEHISPNTFNETETHYVKCHLFT